MLITGELINLTPQTSRVELSILWEYLLGPTDDLQHLTPYWLDIRGCASLRRASQTSTVFSLESPDYRAHFDGEVVTVLGHLYDGGTSLELQRDDETVCEMDARYSSIRTRSHIPSLPAHQRISSISTCAERTTMRKRSIWSLVAHYDTLSHLPRLGHLGNLEPVMGIALLYVSTSGLSTSDTLEEIHGEMEKGLFLFFLAALSLASLVILFHMKADVLAWSSKLAPCWVWRPMTRSGEDVEEHLLTALFPTTRSVDEDLQNAT